MIPQDAIVKKCQQHLPEVRSMGLCIFDPVWALETHSSGQCELYHVITGKVELVTDSGRLSAGPGDTLLIPAGTSHRDEYDLDLGLEVWMIFFSWQAHAEYFSVVTPAVLDEMPATRKAEIANIFDHLRTDVPGESEVDRLVARAHVLTILLLILRDAVRQTEPASDAAELRTRRRQHLMVQAREYLEAHYQEMVSLDDIATALGVSPYYLSHVFSEESDFSLFSYLTALRMNRARALLAEGDRNVSEVAYGVGYENSNYFSKVFRKYFGRPPRDFIGKG